MNTDRMATFVVAFATATFILGLSACDQLLRILSDDEMPQMMGPMIPQLTGNQWRDYCRSELSPSDGAICRLCVPKRLARVWLLKKLTTGNLGTHGLRFLVGG